MKNKLTIFAILMMLFTTLSFAQTLPTAANNTVATGKDVPYTFQVADFGYNDADAHAMVSVTVITFGGPGTLWVDAGAFNGTYDVGEELTLPAVVPVADINANRFNFTPVLGESGSPYSGYAFSVEDGVDGSSDTYAMTINVTNAAPVLANIELPPALAYVENDPATIISTSITVADADDTNLESATIQITGNYQNGEDVLAFTNQLGITGDWDAPTGTMSLAGNSSIANYQTALRTVTYQNTNNNPSTLTRTVSFTVSDGDANSNTETRDISISAANDAPVLADIEAGPITYTENDAAKQITNAITVADFDNTNLASATIQITSNLASAEDVLAFTPVGGITGIYTSGTGTLALTGPSSLANFQTALRSVTYFNSSDDPSALARTVTFTVNDGTTNSNTQTINITVVPVNDPPVLAVFGANFNFTVGDPAASITNSITVTDVDNASMTVATIAITAFDAGKDVLTYTQPIGNPVTGVFNAGTGVLTLTGPATKAQFEAAIKAVTYRNIDPTTVYSIRTLTARINDGTDWSADVTKTITVLPAPPTLVGPTDLKVGVSIVPTFEWTPSAPNGGGTLLSYNLRISTDPTFASGTIVYQTTGLTGSSFTLPEANALNNDVKYYFSMQTVAATGTSIWNTAPFAFITITPAMPYLTTPAHGTIVNGAATTFYWNCPVIGIQYNFQISNSATDFSSPMFETTTTNLYTVVNNSQFTQGGTYYWRVIAKTLPVPVTTPGVIINFSNTWAFYMPGLPQPYAGYPAGNISIYNNPPTLYWYSPLYNPKVSGYVVKYSKTVAGGNADVTGYALDVTPSTDNAGYFSTGSVSTYITIPFALTPGVKYYWQVASTDGATLSTFSSLESFTIYGNEAFVVCYPSFPVGGGSAFTNTPTLYWYTNLYAPGLTYRVQYANNSGFLNGGANVMIEAPGVTTTSYAIPTSLTAGHWYWRVRASFTNGVSEGPWSTVGDFEAPAATAANGLTAPTPAAPVAGTIVPVTNPTLSWYYYSTDPVQYQVIYSTDPSLTSGVLSNILVSGTLTAATPTVLNARPLFINNSFVLTGLTPGATYFWQVRAKSLTTADTYSDWSAVTWFTTAAGSASVVPLAGYPINNTPINNTSAKISWVIPTKSSSTLKYDVQYSKNADFSNAITINNLTSTEIDIENLDKNSRYYWRAASYTSSGIKSEYSAVTSFSTGAVTSVEENEVIPTEYELSQNYPNPFNPTTVISYSIVKNSFVSLKVYDILGREVRTLVNQEMNAGKYNLNWNGDDNFGNRVASGTYIYRITADNFVSSKKMILIK